MMNGTQTLAVGAFIRSERRCWNRWVLKGSYLSLELRADNSDGASVERANAEQKTSPIDALQQSF